MNNVALGTQAVISINVCIAFIVGGLIGYTRVKNKRPAGIRTQALICAGSALLSGLSIDLGMVFAEQGADPTRLIAQIITGIGFLGGGVILRNKGRVKGVTTAAIIWVSAGLGIAIGAGYYLLAFVGYLLVVSTGFIARVEYSTGLKTKPFSITYEKKDRKAVGKMLSQFKMSKTSEYSNGRKQVIIMQSSQQRNSKIIEQLEKEGVGCDIRRLSSIEDY